MTSAPATDSHSIHGKRAGMFPAGLAKFRRLAQEFIWVALGHGSVAVAGLASVKVLTHWMSPAEYGYFALVCSIIAFIQNVVIGPISSGLLRHYNLFAARGELRSFRDIFWTLIGKSLRQQICAGVAVVMVLLAIGRPEWILLAAATTAFAMTSTVSEVLRTIQLAMVNRARVAVHLALLYWGRLGVTVLLFSFAAPIALTAVNGYSAATAFVCLSLLIGWYFVDQRDEAWTRSTAGNARESLYGQIREYMRPLIVGGGLQWVLIASPRWVLQGTLTEDEGGFYSALLQIGYYPVSMASILLIETAVPWLYRSFGDGTNEKRSSTVKKLNNQLTLSVVAFALVLSCITWGFSDRIFTFFVSENYAGVAHLLPWVVLTAGFMAGADVHGMRMWTEMRTEDLIRPRWIGSLLMIAFTGIGAIFFGLPGLILGQLIGAAMYFAILRRA